MLHRTSNSQGLEQSGFGQTLCPSHQRNHAKRTLLRQQQKTRQISSKHRQRETFKCSSSGNDSADPSQDEATKLLDALQKQPGIGSEYGEGFIQYRLSGETTHLDVDTLNEKLKLRGAERLRTAMRPDEAYGMIFCFDGIIADMQQVQHRAWKKLADKEGLPFPETTRSLYGLRPERAVMDVLQWTRDWKTAQRLAYELAHTVAAEFEDLRKPLPGVTDWLVALASVKIPCALVTALDRNTVHAALARMGLRHHFATTVTAEDGMETTSQQFLSAAIKLGRPPQDCVVFESNPLGIAAAHNCSCKAVAVQGPRPGYQLGQADLRCSSLAELSIYNIRRLFANRGSDFMDLKKAFISSKDVPTDNRKWRTVNGTLDP